MIFKIVLLVAYSIFIACCVVHLIRQHYKEAKKYKRTKEWEHRVDLYNEMMGSSLNEFTIPTIRKEYNYRYKLNNGEINYEKRTSV